MAKLPSMTRTERARIAALSRWSREDPTVNAIRGQAGLRARFLAEVEAETPDLPVAEKTRRADCRYRLHMTRLAQRSRAARSSKLDGAA